MHIKRIQGNICRRQKRDNSLITVNTCGQAVPWLMFIGHQEGMRVIVLDLDLGKLPFLRVCYELRETYRPNWLGRSTEEVEEECKKRDNDNKQINARISNRWNDGVVSVIRRICFLFNTQKLERRDAASVYTIPFSGLVAKFTVKLAALTRQYLLQRAYTQPSIANQDLAEQVVFSLLPDVQLFDQRHFKLPRCNDLFCHEVVTEPFNNMCLALYALLMRWDPFNGLIHQRPCKCFRGRQPDLQQQLTEQNLFTCVLPHRLLRQRRLELGGGDRTIRDQEIAEFVC
jgi:hypothetical protein